MSFGVFLSTIVNNSADAMKLAVGATLPHILLTGIFWPLEGIPQHGMITFVRLLPHTETVQGMRDIMLRGWGILESESVLYGILVSSVWIIIFLLISWVNVMRKL